uniref:Uncharacterized protein n=1 Tax=Kalanchoe fedtschenkoi TaxID=63787 RepID=A0A7N0URE5_KALFE
MVHFGGGSLIGASGLQWLVWIQLIVTFLLILLLYCFSLYALEIGDEDGTVSSAEELKSQDCCSGGVGRLLFGRHGAAGTGNLSGVDGETGFLQSRLKVGGSSSIKCEISTSSTNRRIVGNQDRTEGDAASVKDRTSNQGAPEAHYHPCSLFKFAREAFLKCLGLDCLAEDPRSRRRSKND